MTSSPGVGHGSDYIPPSIDYNKAVSPPKNKSLFDKISDTHVFRLITGLPMPGSSGEVNFNQRVSPLIDARAKTLSSATKTNLTCVTLFRVMQTYVPVLNWKERTTTATGFTGILKYYSMKVNYIANRFKFENFGGVGNTLTRTATVAALNEKAQDSLGRLLTIEEKTQLLKEAKTILEYDARAVVEYKEQGALSPDLRKELWEASVKSKKLTKQEVAEKVVKLSDKDGDSARLARPSEQTEALSDFQVIPKQLFITAKEGNLKTGKQYLSDAMVAAASRFQLSFTKVQDLPLSVGNEATKMVGWGSHLRAKPGQNGPLEVDIDSGRVVPTDAKENRKELGVESNRLFNAYTINLPGNKTCIIRTGVINTPEKAAEFYAILQKVKEENPGWNGRVVSQQLNSQENEKHLISDQHKCLRRLNKNTDGIKIRHINTPSNGWVDAKALYQKKYTKIGLSIATGLSSVMNLTKTSAKLFTGEAASRQMNLDSWPGFLDWMVTDMENDVSIESTDSFKALKQQVGEVEKLADEIGEAEDKGDSKRVDKLRNDVKEKLLLIHDRMGAMMLRVPKGNTHYETMELMHGVLNVQLERNIGGPAPSRGQEGMMIQLLNEKLGAVSAMNCKSGLDRTGIWHAVKLAVTSMTKKLDAFGVSAFSLVTRWDSTTGLLNKITRDFGPAGAAVIAKAGQGKLMNDEDKKTLREIQDQYPDVKNKSTLQHMAGAFAVRQEILHNMLTTGHSVTEKSTGVRGFKWNKGINENRVALNFLPTHVLKTDASGKPIVGQYTRLVNCDDTGQPTSLTNEGRRLLVQLGLQRAS